MSASLLKRWSCVVRAIAPVRRVGIRMLWFLEQAQAHRLHRAHADVELARDLLVRQAPRDEHRHVALARAQRRPAPPLVLALARPGRGRTGLCEDLLDLRDQLIVGEELLARGVGHDAVAARGQQRGERRTASSSSTMWTVRRVVGLMGCVD
jgi:hypothetical protein